MSPGQKPEPQILGRQPDLALITPSKPNPWYGTVIDGRRYTEQQLRALDAIKAHPDRVASIVVRRNATTREAWWPKSSPTPQYEFECPVRSRKGDRVEVISPSGILVWIGADGSTAQTTISKGKIR